METSSSPCSQLLDASQQRTSEHKDRPLYQDLDVPQREIRLIRILPAQTDSEVIQCQLDTVSLSTPGLQYAALSYTWGNPNKTRRIFINGTKFDVRENLYNALYQFRSNAALLSNGQNSILPLWADAVCINQGDNDERSQQVLLMDSIYSSATKVISWLETGVENGEDALSTIRDIVEAAFKDKADGINEASLQDFIKSWHPQIGELDPPSPEEPGNIRSPFLSIERLLEQPYWRRVWVLQELVLAKSAGAHLFACGNDFILYDDMIKYTEVLEFLRQPNIRQKLNLNVLFWRPTSALQLAIFNSVAEHRNDHPKYSKRRVKEKFHPMTILALSLMHEATDPKDFIYGFLSLVDMDVTVNYNKDVRDIYQDWYICSGVLHRDDPTIHAGQGLRGRWVYNPILYAGRGLYERWEHDLPSWLPDLSRNNQRAFVQRRTHGKPLALEYLKSSPFPHAEVVGYVLHISGLKCCGKIIEVFPRPPDELADFGDMLHNMSFSVLARSNRRDHHCGISALQALYYTIHKGLDPETGEDLPIPPNPHIGNTFEAFRSLGVFNSSLHWNEQKEDKDYVAIYGPGWKRAGYNSYREIMSALDADFCKGTNYPPALDSLPLTNLFNMVKGATHLEFLAPLLVGYRGKTIFQTEDGYIGIGPGGLREGDQPYILDRVWLPMLLRKDGENYLNVGACYIYGASNGEATGAIKPGDPRIERFKIH